jgi:hypothetical protein
MTPTEIMDLARYQYNATSDGFFVQAEMLNYIYWAETELAVKSFCIRDIHTTTTVASQQDYTYPTYTMSVKRVTYDGNKLTPIDMRDDDDLTLLNQATTATGTPEYYYDWNRTIYLRQIPDDAKTLKMWCINKPEPILLASVLEVPLEYHLAIVDCVLYRMAMKDNNFAAAKEYKLNWDNAVKEAQKLERRKLRSDMMAAVKDVDQMVVTKFGSL